MRFSQRLVPCLVAGSLAVPATAATTAEEPAAASAPWYERVAQRVETTWDEGQPEIYLPLHTYHLRFAYSRQKIDSYDETALGLGFGRGVYDDKGDWRGLYVMGFQDSHFKPQYIAGYGYKTYWRLSGELRFGAGFTAFLTTRADLGHYVPVPGVLPLVSLEYRKFSLDSAYVPGGRGFGNVLFFWGKMRF
jgi:palmitoyl transferase